MSELVRISFPAKADYLLLARLALAGIARDVDVSDELLADLKLAVTEACTNVVRHAYSGREGAIEVQVEPDDSHCLSVVVTDHGHGIRPNPAGDGPGLGLPLIAALTSQLEIEHEPDRGSRVSMQFRPAGSVPGP